MTDNNYDAEIVPLTEITFEVHKSNQWKLEHRIEKMNKKAKRYGLPEIEMEIVDEGTRKRIDPVTFMPTGYVDPVIYVKLSGTIPPLDGGWELIAIIDHVGEPGDRGWLISQIPWTVDEGIEVPEHYRTDDPYCDHCQTKRSRSMTFVIRSEDGEWKRVGRQCLKDYTQGHSAAQYAWYLNDLHAIRDDDYRSIQSSKSYFDTKEFLIVCAALIEMYGWTSKRDESMDPYTRTSTASRAMNHFYKEDEDLEITDRHEAKALEALAWLEETIGQKPDDELNGYQYNLLIAGTREYTATKHAGIVASLISAYERSKMTKETRERQAAESEYQGEVGKRDDFILKVVRRFDMERGSYSGYGTDVVRLTIMEDDNGNVFLWRTTAVCLEEGEKFYKVRGTVKAHDEYQGTKQTVLTRCKVTCAECGGDLDHLPLISKGYAYDCLEHYDGETPLDRGWLKTSQAREVKNDES